MKFGECNESGCTKARIYRRCRLAKDPTEGMLHPFLKPRNYAIYRPISAFKTC